MTKSPLDSKSSPKKSKTLSDYLPLVKNTRITAYQTRSYVIRGRVETTGELRVALAYLLKQNGNQATKVLTPVFDCQTKEDLDKINVAGLTQQLMQLLIPALSDRFRSINFTYNGGDIDITDDEIDYVSDVDCDELEIALQRFVESVVEQRHQELAGT
jgi:hypothetical protein